jgi:hypothetical protein
MGAAEDPVSDVFPAEWPEESQADAVQSFVDTHVSSTGGSVISREDVATQADRDNNKHEHFGVILDRLEYNELAILKGNAIFADIFTVCSRKAIDDGLGEWGVRSEMRHDELCVLVLKVSCRPVGSSWDRATGIRRGNDGCGDKSSGGSSRVEVRKGIRIEKVVNETCTQLKRATGGEICGQARNGGCRW